MKKYLFLFVSILALIIACSKEDEPAPPPPTPKFTVSFSAGEGGSVSTTGGTYDKGTKVSVTATPDGEFVFDKWSDGNTDNPREITVSSNLSLSASFIKKKYALSVTVEGEGTVEEEIIVQGSTSSTEYNSGTTVKLTATPSDEWVFSGWSGDIESTDNPIEVSVDEAKSITATFKLKQYDLTVTVEGEGTVSETIVTQPTLYDSGTVVKLEATPSDEWVFSGWSGDIESTDNPIEVSVDEAKSITATFKLKQYDLTVTVEGEGTVSETIVTQPTLYDSGTVVKLEATPSDEWVFSGWSGDIESTDNPIEVTVSEAKSITATFKLKQYDLTVTVEGEGTVSETIVTQPTLYDSGTVVKLEATPSDEWVFSGWSGDIESTDNPIEVTVSEAKSITATFKLKQYDLTVTVEGEGTVSETIVTQPTLYDSGTVVKLEATPSDEWVFSGWSGDIESTDNPIEVTVSEAKSITATFNSSYDLRLNIEGKGTIKETLIVGTSSNRYTTGDIVEIEAIPEPGWEFLKWTGSLAAQGTNENPTRVEFRSSFIEATAIFQPLPLLINLKVNGNGIIRITREDGTILESNNNYNVVGEIVRVDRTTMSSFGVHRNEELQIEFIPDDYWKLNSYNGSLEGIDFSAPLRVNEEELDIEVTYEMDLPENYTISEFDFYPDFEISWSNLSSTFSDPCGKFYLKNETGEYFLFGGTTPVKSDPTPSILFKKVNGEWIVHRVYNEASMGQPRNFKVVDDNKFVLSDSGEHGAQPWLGDLYYGELLGEDIVWKRVNDDNEQGFFHGVTMGDLNNDGFLDFGGVPNTSADGGVLYSYGIFIQESAGVFTKKNSLWEPANDMPFAIEFQDLNQDGIDEIIVASYGGRHNGVNFWNSDLNRIEIYYYNSNSNKFELEFRSEQNPAYGENGAFATSIRSSDFNNDGLIDISIAREGYPGGSFEIYLNNGDGSFELTFTKLFQENELRFREFLVMDANNDGIQDIVLRTNGGSLFWPDAINPGQYFIDEKKINLNHSIWLGNGDGTFNSYQAKDLTFESFLNPFCLNPFMRDGKLCFFGPSAGNYPETDGFARHSVVEIEIDLTN